METPSKNPAEIYVTLLADIKTQLADVPDDKLEVLVRLTNRLDELSSEIVDAKTALVDLESKKRRLEQQTIPELMTDVLGVTVIGLPDGRQVNIIPFVSAHITDEKKSEALKWLRDNGYDGIIKKELTVTLGKTPDKDVKNLVASIITAGFKDIEVGETVHGQTLKKWAKETLAAQAKASLDGGSKVGDPVPEELFGIFNGRTTKIK